MGSRETLICAFFSFLKIGNDLIKIFDGKYVDNIFSLFERLNSKDKYEGAGIGLAIAKKIIEKHDGLITAKSAEGEGATFQIVLPLKK